MRKPNQLSLFAFLLFITVAKGQKNVQLSPNNSVSVFSAINPYQYTFGADATVLSTLWNVRMQFAHGLSQPDAPISSSVFAGVVAELPHRGPTSAKIGGGFRQQFGSNSSIFSISPVVHFERRIAPPLNLGLLYMPPLNARAEQSLLPAVQLTASLDLNYHRYASGTFIRRQPIHQLNLLLHSGFQFSSVGGELGYRYKLSHWHLRAQIFSDDVSLSKQNKYWDHQWVGVVWLHPLTSELDFNAGFGPQMYLSVKRIDARPMGFVSLRQHVLPHVKLSVELWHSFFNGQEYTLATFGQLGCIFDLWI